MRYQIDPEFKDIWTAALNYQDTRNDKGHAFIVTLYAQDICTYEGTDRHVVVPAAILHDIGWSKVPKEESMLVFAYGVDKNKMLQIRQKHQDEGVRLAKELLTTLHYPDKYVAEILEIISQHDTRDGFISNNEGAMRDADKLWRFDDYGFLNDNQNSGCDFKTELSSLEKKLNLASFFHFESSRVRASKLLDKLKSKYID